MSIGTGIAKDGDPGKTPHLPAHMANTVSTLHIAHRAPTE